MTMKFHMPTRIVMGANCVQESAQLVQPLGRKALIVTGSSSAKRNGSLDDVQAMLAQNKQDSVIYDRVEPNPSIACAYDGADLARKHQVDFIIAIGGGSPMDAAKAIAILARQDLPEDQLFTGPYSEDVLPMVHIPTTSGTGSEVTPYAILTNDSIQSKSNMATPLIFPRLALLDARYTRDLPLTTTVNTALDALSHCIEGYLSIRSSPWSDLVAREGIGMIASCFAGLRTGQLDQPAREKLLYASMLGGVVIAQTGTIVVHALGYSLTYFKDIDHGRANGLLLASYLKQIKPALPGKVEAIVSSMGFSSLDELERELERLIGPRESILKPEALQYSHMAMKTRNIGNCLVQPNQKDLEDILFSSLNTAAS